MRIVVTGFEPFGGSDINSSWETAALIGQRPPKDVDMEVLCLPVSFKRVGAVLQEVLSERQPDVLVMLGQKGSGKSIDIERIAVNLMHTENSDNDGYSPDEMPICRSGEAAYFSNLPVKDLRDSILKEGIVAKVSNSAGLYVCNCTYYNALKTIKELNLPTKAVFVHVPKISEEFPAEKLAGAILLIIEQIKLII